MSQSPPPRADQDHVGLADRLSTRQSDCLRLAAKGLSSREIGQRLNLSARTVDDHILLGCRLLGVRTRVQAVARLARDDRRAPEPRSFTP
ncbi:helix-turn-helix transcriptional regulator [Brevundimonas sp.]|uniref:helix-turn-helix domain-containing protein n=1 Tax=Brevundimonas sp. TaxID=1871086 RepID=UPI001A329C5E|nr:helix-turn-helix transcriptional regulator [Brevundimonas sp.]MBJ7483476.1 helix-turn-helix transcriptional regulator [Brevundimonas sp.]